jgi:hypothetical protein
LEILALSHCLSSGAPNQAKLKPLSPSLTQLCCAVESSSWLPSWLVSEKDLVTLQKAVGSDTVRLRTLLKMHALRPDLAISPELVDLVEQVTKRCKKDSDEGRSLIVYLAEAGVEPEKLVELLYPEFTDLEGLLDYYAYQPCLEAVPALINLLPKSEVAVRRALYRQLRVDLGADPAKWRAWIAKPHHEPVERGKQLLLNGDAGGLLWSARGSDLSVLSNGALPRLVQRISAQQVGELWVDAGRVGRKDVWAPQRDWCWELSTGKSLWPIPERMDTYFRGISRPSGELLLEYDSGAKPQAVWQQNGKFQHLAIPEAKREADVNKLIAEQNFDPPDIHTEARDSLFYQTGQCPGLSLSDYKNKEGQRLFDTGMIGRLSRDGRWRALALMGSPGGGANSWSDETFLTLWNTSLRRLDLELQVPCRVTMSLMSTARSMSAHCFSPDSRWLAIAADKLTLVSTEGDAPHTVATQAIKARSLAFQPKAERLAAGTENELVLMHLPDLKVEQTIRGLGPVNGLAYSPDGSLLAVALQDEIRVYQTKTPWPTLEGQDPQLLSELWTGMRLSGGAAVRLSEGEFKQRLARWKSETGSDWWDGCPKPVSQPGRAEFPPLALAGLAVSAASWDTRFGRDGEPQFSETSAGAGVGSVTMSTCVEH